MMCLKATEKEIETKKSTSNTLRTKLLTALFKMMKDVASPDSHAKLGAPGDGDGLQSVVDALKAALANTTAVEACWLETESAIGMLKGFATVGAAPPAGQTFASLYAAKRQKGPKGDSFLKSVPSSEYWKKNSEYISAVKLALKKHDSSAGTATDDDDIEIAAGPQGDAKFRCPIGKNIMVEPVQNPCVATLAFSLDALLSVTLKPLNFLACLPPSPPRPRTARRSCKHRYDRQHITGLMKNSHELRCPVVGCGKTVKRSELSVDEVFKADIESYTKMREKEADVVDDVSDSHTARFCSEIN